MPRTAAITNRTTLERHPVGGYRLPPITTIGTNKTSAAPAIAQLSSARRLRSDAHMTGSRISEL
jgi:hypothetical protein